MLKITSNENNQGKKGPTRQKGDRLLFHCGLNEKGAGYFFIVVCPFSISKEDVLPFHAAHPKKERSIYPVLNGKKNKVSFLSEKVACPLFPFRGGKNE